MCHFSLSQMDIVKAFTHVLGHTACHFTTYLEGLFYSSLNICTLVALYKFYFGVNYFGVGRLVYSSTFKAFRGLTWLSAVSLPQWVSLLSGMDVYTFRSFKKSNCFFDYSNHLSFFPENFNSFCHFIIKLKGLFWLNFHPFTFLYDFSQIKEFLEKMSHLSFLSGNFCF